MNSASISGRLTRKPELRRTNNGKSVLSFSVAVQRPHVKDQTDFIDCVAWDSTAEFIANYFDKGKWIECTGVLTTRDFDAKDGTKRKITEIRVDDCGFGGAKKSDYEDKTADKAFEVPSDMKFYDASDTDEALPF